MVVSGWADTRTSGALRDRLLGHRGRASDNRLAFLSSGVVLMSETRKARQKIVDGEMIALQISEFLSDEDESLSDREARDFLKWLAEELDAYDELILQGRRPDRQMVSR
jgi:hypothetical protein